MLQATNEATMALQDLTDAGARKEQIQAAYQLYQQAIAAAEIAKKPTPASRISSMRE